jgi:hypothetical protein
MVKDMGGIGEGWGEREVNNKQNIMLTAAKHLYLGSNQCYCNEAVEMLRPADDTYA